jgi:hypothetical protein
LKTSVFCFGLWILLGLGCEQRQQTAPLGPDEEALVQTYVRLTVLQALHDAAPDSSLMLLRDLEGEIDTVSVRQALDALAVDPLRWEIVYSAITTRLEELEGTPSLWWRVAKGDSLPPPVEPPPATSARTPAPGR